MIVLLNPGDVVNELITLPANTILTGREETGFEVIFKERLVGIPAFQAKSRVIPPRTRAPVMAPEDHWSGNAGRRVIIKGADQEATSGA